MILYPSNTVIFHLEKEKIEVFSPKKSVPIWKKSYKGVITDRGFWESAISLFEFFVECLGFQFTETYRNENVIHYEVQEKE